MQLKQVLQVFAARARLLELLPAALTVTLIALVAYRLAQLTWMVIPAPELTENIPADAPRVTAQVRSPAAAVSISTWSLFGKVPVTAAPQEEEAVVIPETRLNLTLLGVIASSANATAKAIISDPSGNEEYYSVGMQVPGGATLEEIHTDHVMLRRNNRLEMLRLPVDEELPGANASRASPVAQAPTRRLLPPGVGGDTRSSGAMLREYRDALNHDPQSVMDLVRAEPVREGDALIGFKISPGRDRQLLTKFGLHPGDVVTSINGIRLDNMVRGLEVIQNLQTASQVSVEVVRNGVTQSFSFNIE